VVPETNPAQRNPINNTQFFEFEWEETISLKQGDYFVLEIKAAL